MVFRYNNGSELMNEIDERLDQVLRRKRKLADRLSNVEEEAGNIEFEIARIIEENLNPLIAVAELIKLPQDQGPFSQSGDREKLIRRRQKKIGKARLQFASFVESLLSDIQEVAQQIQSQLSGNVTKAEELEIKKSDDVPGMVQIRKIIPLTRAVGDLVEVIVGNQSGGVLLEKRTIVIDEVVDELEKKSGVRPSSHSVSQNLYKFRSILEGNGVNAFEIIETEKGKH